MEGNEKECFETDNDLEGLSTKLDDKVVVVSLDEVNWEEAVKDLKWVLLVKFASGKSIRKDLVVNNLWKVWKLRQQAEFFKVERNILMVIFGNQEDKEKIFDVGPWLIEGEAVLLQKWEVGMT